MELLKRRVTRRVYNSRLFPRHQPFFLSAISNFSYFPPLFLYLSTITMFLKSSLLASLALLHLASADSAGYSLPSSGAASTTQFYLGPELGGGTACGMSALPNGKGTSGRQGGGPGYLYVCPHPLSSLLLPSLQPPSHPSLSIQAVSSHRSDVPSAPNLKTNHIFSSFKRPQSTN